MVASREESVAASIDELKTAIADLKQRRNTLLSDYRDAIAAFEQTKSEALKNRALEAHSAAAKINDEINELEVQLVELEDSGN